MNHSILTSPCGAFFPNSFLFLAKHDLHLCFHSLLNSVMWNGNCWTVWRMNTVSQIVLPREPALVYCLLQWCSLKELGHEGKAALFDVRLSSEGVEDWISTATGEGESRGHRSALVSDHIQSAKMTSFILKSQTIHWMGNGTILTCLGLCMKRLNHQSQKWKKTKLGWTNLNAEVCPS